jgi:ribosomal protein S1
MEQMPDDDERWAALERLRDADGVVVVKIVQATAGGFIVDVHGLHGILPLSRILWPGGFPGVDALASQMQAMVGDRIRVKLLEVAPPTRGSKGRLAVDQKAAGRS